MHLHHDHVPGSCSQDCHSCGGCENPTQEQLAALLKYMTGHNASHIRELSAVADQLEKAGNPMAAAQVRTALSEFEMGNMRLELVQRSLG